VVVGTKEEEKATSETKGLVDLFALYMHWLIFFFFIACAQEKASSKGEV